MNNGETSPEVPATPEQLSRAFEEGVRLAAGLPSPAGNPPIGNASGETDAYKLGLEKGHEIMETSPNDSNVRTLEAANAVEAYKQGQVKPN